MSKDDCLEKLINENSDASCNNKNNSNNNNLIYTHIYHMNPLVAYPFKITDLDDDMNHKMTIRSVSPVIILL